MRLISSLLAICLLPTTVWALTYRDNSKLYTDVPFNPAESAGISVLTEIGAVAGYPDGSFQPQRTLNRAEFLKIVIASYPKIIASNSDAEACFPDVAEFDWFSRYVCLAKRRGIIEGYPDGYFRPENQVNYVEALKILGELYDYTAYAGPDDPWYTMYVQAAINHKVNLPVNLAYDAYLTRGQMARLAAAYLAEDVGELEYYRRFERGEYIDMEAESSSSSSVSSESSETSSTSSESSVPATTLDVPTPNRLLMVGEYGGSIADAALPLQGEDVEIRIFKVILEREARSLDRVYLLNELGEQIGTLKLDVHDRDDETWIIEFAPGSGPELTGDLPRIGVGASLKKWGQGGFSQDWVEVKTLFVVVGELGDQTQTYQVIPADTHYPVHQTVQAKVTESKSLWEGAAALLPDNQTLVGSWQISGRSLPEGVLSLKHLHFTATAPTGIEVANWTLGRGDERFACNTSDEFDREVDCLALPDSIGLFGDQSSLQLDLYVDINTDDASIGDTLQVEMLNKGSLSELGDIRFSDGSSDFQWIEQSEPLGSGPLLQH